MTIEQQVAAAEAALGKDGGTVPANDGALRTANKRKLLAALMKAQQDAGKPVAFPAKY